jgi:DNA-binding transcriptional LysR family regulator
MITLKQIEALHWIVLLGTFERAAARLNTTQSAISKRIQELELSCGLDLFDRNQRGARLTEAGEQVLVLGRQMLSLQERLLALKSGGQVPARRLRLGVTELSALTWMPRLVTALRQAYPTLQLEPDVDTSRNLHDRLLDDTLDIIMIPEAFSDPEVTTVRLAEVPNAWMARPGLVTQQGPLEFSDLAEYLILSQGSRSGSGIFYDKWMKSEGIVFPRVLSTDNLTALVGLTVAGLGISYLPRQCFRALVELDKLVQVQTRVPLPPVPYAAMFRNDRPFAFTSAVAELARDVCDFSRQLQG